MISSIRSFPSGFGRSSRSRFVVKMISPRMPTEMIATLTAPSA